MNPIETSIYMGIDIERDDPNLKKVVESITPEQISWIASWLEGEGFKK